MRKREVVVMTISLLHLIHEALCPVNTKDPEQIFSLL